MATCTIVTRKGLEVIQETLTSPIAEMINQNFYVLGDHLDNSNIHIDHSLVSIATASTGGLSGGGTIAANRDLIIDIPGLTAETTVDNADLVMLYDDSFAALRKMTVANLLATVVPNSSMTSIGWAETPTFNDVHNLAGWNEITDTAQALSSAVPFTMSTAGYHSHVVLDISAAVGLPFTVRVTGRSIDEDDGTTTPSDTEDIAVTANGYYQTTKSWIDAVSISIVEGSKSCIVDAYRTSYWNRGSEDFHISGSRMEWTPGQNTWNIQMQLLHVENNGSIDVLDDITFASTDAIPRAAKKVQGKYTRNDYNADILGNNKEGIVVIVDQTGIRDFSLEIKYNRQV